MRGVESPVGLGLDGPPRPRVARKLSDKARKAGDVQPTDFFKASRRFEEAGKTCVTIPLEIVTRRICLAQCAIQYPACDTPDQLKQIEARGLDLFELGLSACRRDGRLYSIVAVRECYGTRKPNI
jgi:hypothetical protein